MALALLASVQSPAVQSWVGRKVIERIRNKIDADISYKMVGVRPFEAITLDDVLITDRSPKAPGADTVAFVGSLSAKFSIWGLLSGSGAYLSHAKVEDAAFFLVSEPDSIAGSTTNLQRIFRIPPSQSDTPPTWGNLLSARELEAGNVRFRMKILNTPEDFVHGKIDFSDLDVLVHHLSARNIKVADSRISASLDSLTATEKSGFAIKGARASKVRVGMGHVRVDHLDLREEYSDVHLERLELEGSLKDYSDFVERIRISGTVKPGTLVSMKTVSFFGPLEEYMDFRGYVSGKVSGYVNDISLKDIEASDADHNFSAKVSGRVMNATDIQNLALDIKLSDSKFTMNGLEGFLHSWAPDVKLGLDSFAPGESFAFRGTAKGPINRLGVNGTLSSRLGLAKADITVRNTVDLKRPIIIDGGLRTQDLNVGEIAGIDAIGPVTLGTGLSATIPKNGGLSVRIDSLKIDRLNALGYDYTNISAVGNYAEDAFDGRIIAADPNLSFLFQGKFNLSRRTRNKVYRFYASLGYADLHALKIDKRPNSKISLQASSNFLVTESHDVLGDVLVSGITLESATGVHYLGDLTAKAHANDNVHRINIQSKFLEGTYYGDKAPFDFVNHLRSLTLDREASALSTESAPAWDGSTYSLNLKVKGAHDLLDFLAPGTYVANPTEISLAIDRDGILTGRIGSDRIALGEKFIRNLDLAVSNASDVLKADLSSSMIQISRDVRLLGSRLSLFANDNHLGLGYSFDNSESDNSKAELYLSAELSRDSDNFLAVLARALPSNFYYNGAGWGISSGDILYRGGNVSIDHLTARHDDELLDIAGGYSSNSADTLRVRMEKFDVGIVSGFIGNLLPIEGYASGNAVVISPGNPIPGIEASIICDSTRVSGQRMGTLALNSNWDEPSKRFNIKAQTTLDGQKPIDINGYFMPDGQKIFAEALFNKFNLASVSPILSTVFSTFDGRLDGAVNVSGPVSKMSIGSHDLKLTEGHIALDFTRALYDVEGELAVTQDALSFRELRLRDNAGGNGTVKGDILLNGFKELGTNLKVSLDKIKALDLKRGENSTLYGTVPVSGNLTVKGPLSRIVVDINAATSGPGELHLPIGGASGEVQRKMLVFTEPVSELQQDPYELMMASNTQQQAQATNLIINLTARATPDATVFIDLGENTLNARGSGTIGINLETAQNSFGLSGDYTLQEGSFRFSAMNLVSRDFTIQDGSSVRFNGPVNETDLNVKGLYITKASLDNLITSASAESSSGSGRRTVNCGIDISGKLSNPEVQFSIDVPDLNPSSQIALESALSTEDKIQKQFIYLLIAGSFLPDEDSGITSTGSDMLFSNVSSIMSGQINNIFEKLNIPLDLGLNYKAQEGRNMFDVAVSTQLFNNRVIVNGAVGNKQMIGSTTSEITGDVDVEIKVTKNGNLRTTIFSHSSDQFSSYLDNSQRNGVGIAYQKEFYSFPQLFGEVFMSRQEREERAARRLAGVQVEQSVVQIDSTGKSKAIENEVQQ